MGECGDCIAKMQSGEKSSVAELDLPCGRKLAIVGARY